MTNPITDYFGQVRQELTRVTFPTRSQLKRLTAVVLLISTGVGLYLGVLDYLFKELLKQLVG